jgi:xanthine/uracil permease
MKNIYEIIISGCIKLYQGYKNSIYKDRLFWGIFLIVLIIVFLFNNFILNYLSIINFIYKVFIGFIFGYFISIFRYKFISRIDRALIIKNNDNKYLRSIFIIFTYIFFILIGIVYFDLINTIYCEDDDDEGKISNNNSKDDDTYTISLPKSLVKDGFDSIVKTISDS